MAADRPPGGTSSLKCASAWRAKWPELLSGAVLAAAAIAVYSRSFSVPLLYDDNSAIVDNATIRHWSTAFLPPVNTSTTGRPVLNLSLAVNHAISGTAVWSYHALNLAIHILAGLTLFGIVRRTLRLRSGQVLGRGAEAESSLIAFFAALLWTLHPLQTESVTYIVQRAESLMGLFYLLTVYCFIRGICAERAGRVSWVWFTLSVVSCLLGVGTKEVIVSAPLIVLLYDRTFEAGSFREALRVRWGIHLSLVATWLPLAGLVASTGWDRNGMSGFDVGVAPWAYWLTQFEAVARYLWLSVWPHPLVFEYGTFWVTHPAKVALCAPLVAGLAVAVLVALWRRPAAGFLGAWFFVILAPTSIVPGRMQMIVEHRMYLPLAAVVVAGVVGLHNVLRTLRDNGPRDNGPRDNGQRITDHGQRTTGPTIADNGPQDDPTTGRRTGCLVVCGLWSCGLVVLWSCGLWSCGLWSCGPVVCGLVVCGLVVCGLVVLRSCGPAAHGPVVPMVLLLALGLGALTVQRNEDYRSALAIWGDTVAKRPDNERALVSLGNAWMEMPGRLDDAIAQYEAALRLRPDLAEAHYNLGVALAHRPERLNEAIVQYEEALRLKPDYAEAHSNLGNVLNTVGRVREAIAQCEAALRLNPDFAEAHNNLGNALNAVGRTREAIAEYETVLRLRPDLAAAHDNLGNALAAMGRTDDAISEYESALRLKPDYAEAHNNLGYVLMKIPGRLNDAVAQYQEALRLKPDYAEAHNNLGNAFNAAGRTMDAIAEYKAALRLKPDFAEAHNNLGINLEKIPGRLDDAIAQYEAALRLKPDDATAHYNLGNARNVGGRTREAIVEYEAALRLKPNYAEAHTNLGFDLAQLPGRLNDAIAQFEEALRLESDDAPAHFNLALALLEIPGRTAEAVTHLEAVLRIQPGNGPAREVLAQIRASRP
jgi:tetratricopeptide (TPR) repeat protein